MITVKPQLLKILKEKDITQAQLSTLTKVPQSAISRFDKNVQHTDVHVFSIVKALDITVEDLFKVEGEL